jgi:phenylacetic acid degradation operon negative regulatory protein
VSAGYQQFIDQFEPLLALPAIVDPEQAFVIRTLLIHAYRRVQLHDPMLPVELLPDPWPGARAYELARALYRKICAPAEQHVMAAMLREDEQSPAADAAFLQRFGGLA